MDLPTGPSQQYSSVHGERSPLQETFDSQSYQRSQRPRPADIIHEYPADNRNKQDSLLSDAKTPKLNKRSSRFGLTGFFGKSKTNLVETQRGNLDTQWEASEPAQSGVTKTPGIPNKTWPASSSLEISALPEMEGPAAPLRQRSSRAGLRTRPSFKRDNNVGRSIPWSPPPLFQVYPQAVKHATLRVPSLSAEYILRLSSEKDTSTSQKSESYASSTNTAKAPKEKKARRSRISDVLAKAAWVDKVFVVVTSGYILQYAGNGLYDRLPEKIMPLSKDSAAFASDAIPGKPYVLQISQVSDDEGTLDTEASRSLFKKLGLRIESKRSTSCFLLVLESPEDMSAWLVTVRKEIQAMGGKEYKPDEFCRPATRDATSLLQQRPSQRYLVKRDPKRFSGNARPSPTEGSFRNKPLRNEGHEVQSNIKSPSENGQDLPTGDTDGDWVNIKRAPKPPVDRTPAAANRHSLATQRSTETRSASNTTASINQMYLDGLRESPRQSYASTGARTVATSRDSSPGSSPAKYQSDYQDWTAYPYGSPPLPSGQSGNARVWIAPSPSPGPDNQEVADTNAAPSASEAFPPYVPKHRRTPSPAAPNFSVPTFSKRYSTATTSLASANSMAPLPTVTLLHEPPSPTVTSKGNNKLAKPHPGDERRHVHDLSAPHTLSYQGKSHLPTPPPSSGSHGNPSLDVDRPYSHRFSSLEYARGISPVKLTTPTPAPHPPPTATLPPVPTGDRPSRASLIPPPQNTFPVKLTKVTSRYSMLPPPTKQSSALTVVRPSSSSAATSPPSNFQNSFTQKPANGPEKTDFVQRRKLRKPISMQVRKEPGSNHPLPPLPSTVVASDTSVSRPAESASVPPTTLGPTRVFAEVKPPTDVPSPPRPTRDPPPPPPPPQRPPLITRGSSGRVGREPPPVSSPVRNKISITSRAENYFDSPAPHPCIPPIKVSERKFRGSLDGPWNMDYSAPQRNFFDLSVG
ncbi:hypothetical protein JMJ35_010095 [Cladonia borealis]|uniref:PH domain-containing protein n=1 Tax=Cladonia borealis TaxID=184061 RepID=A0AA39QQZ8_9LECA|nr:hypothetical protein JMJ35_010095 [Cladonia borealis]